MDKKGWKRISRRERTSTVWLAENWLVYKSAPKFLIDNELFFLNKLWQTGYVPVPVTRHEVELISMPYIENQKVTDPDAFLAHIPLVIGALQCAMCRHGDLTEYSVLVNNNKPVIIDFGESRYYDSPLPDKRREGDRHWLTLTMEKLANDR